VHITRSRSFKANLGNYEAFDVFVSIGVNHQDLGYTDEEWREEMDGSGADAAIQELRLLAELHLSQQIRTEIENINKLREGEPAQQKSVLGHV
jgi:hypothetical protein